MRIGIDGRIFIKPGSGMVRYSFELTQSLLSFAPENEYIVYVYKNASHKEKINFKGNYKIREVSLPPILWRTPLFTKILDRDKLDVYHSMHYIVPFVPKQMRKTAILCTCHGMFVKYPNLKEKFYWGVNYWASAKFSDRIITVSDQMQKEMHERYGTPFEKMDSGYLGINENLRVITAKEKAEFMQRLGKKYGLGNSGFVSYLGAGMAPNKNVITIIRAWKILREKYNFKLPIIITRVKIEKLKPEIEANGLKPGIDVIGVEWLDEEDVLPLYGCADINVYASVYEGAGWPVIEAMACGTPVIISNASAMPEVAGGAALMVEKPMDPEEWAQKIYTLHTDKALREKLIRLGIERAKKFNWEEVAKRVIIIYQKEVRH